MSRGISARRAAEAREIVLRTREHQRRLDAYRLARAKKDAEGRIASLKKQLTPAYRLRLSQSLAQWEAHLDALEDDGGHAIPKGHE